MHTDGQPCAPSPTPHRRDRHMYTAPKVCVLLLTHVPTPLVRFLRCILLRPPGRIFTANGYVILVSRRDTTVHRYTPMAHFQWSFSGGRVVFNAMSPPALPSVYPPPDSVLLDFMKMDPPSVNVHTPANPSAPRSLAWASLSDTLTVSCKLRPWAPSLPPTPQADRRHGPTVDQYPRHANPIDLFAGPWRRRYSYGTPLPTQLHSYSGLFTRRVQAGGIRLSLARSRRSHSTHTDSRASTGLGSCSRRSAVVHLSVQFPQLARQPAT